MTENSVGVSTADRGVQRMSSLHPEGGAGDDLMMTDVNKAPLPGLDLDDVTACNGQSRSDGTNGGSVVPTAETSRMSSTTYLSPQHLKSAVSTGPPPSNTAIVRDFCQHTTAHGWGHLELQTRRALRLLWLILIVVVYALAAMHVSVLVKQYFDYPSEQISRIQVESLKFPSVTLCNIVPVSFTSAGQKVRDRSSDFFRWHNLTRQFLDRRGDMFNSGNASKLRKLLYSRLQHPIAFYENTGDEAMQVGHQVQDFVIRCSFGYEQCDVVASFTLFASPTYYNCYTFNAMANDANSAFEKPQVDAKATGPQQGLSVILYLENDSDDDKMNDATYHTISNVGNAAGVRVVVHEYGTLPFPVDQGIDIPPGFSTSLGLRVTKYVRLPQPYGECQPDMSPLNVVRGIGRRQTTYAYSTHACMALCQQRYIAERCRCVSSLYPVPAQQASLKFCGYFNESDTEFYFSNLSCEAERIVEFSKNDSLRTRCRCLPSCEEYSYAVDSSYSYWPVDVSHDSFFDVVLDAHPLRERLKAYQHTARARNESLHSNGERGRADGGGFVRRNFVRINVYFKDMMLEEMEQKRSYEVQNLFSDIGGTCGLWVGVSVLSYCEVVELLCTLVAKMATRLRLNRTYGRRQT